MLFNSIEFAIFLPIVFLLYWFAFGRNLKLQNLFVVLASYVFYGWWDWRFLVLIAFTSFCSWGSGMLMARYMTEYYNNYLDPDHFGLWVGWHMIEEIYNTGQHSASEISRGINLKTLTHI